MFVEKFICDECFSEMDVYEEDYNRFRVHCPCCGSEWYVDAEGEYINDDFGSFHDDDFELANFCHGGDLIED